MKWIGVGIGIGFTAIGCGLAVIGSGDVKCFTTVPAVAFFLGLFASLSD